MLEDGSPLATDVRDALRRAITESADLRHDYLGTEHLLLGMLGLNAGTAATVLAECGVTYSDARASVVAAIGQPPPPDARILRRIPATPTVDRIIRHAVGPGASGGRQLGSGDLLLSLIDDNTSVVRYLLPDADAVRSRLTQRLKSPSH